MLLRRCRLTHSQHSNMLAQMGNKNGCLMTSSREREKNNPFALICAMHTIHTISVSLYVSSFDIANKTVTVVIEIRFCLSALSLSFFIYFCTRFFPSFSLYVFWLNRISIACIFSRSRVCGGNNGIFICMQHKYKTFGMQNIA